MTIRKIAIAAMFALSATIVSLPHAFAGDRSGFNRLVMIFVAYEAECDGTLPDRIRDYLETRLAAMSEDEQIVAFKQIQEIEAQLGHNKKRYCELFEQTVIHSMSVP